MRIVFDSQCKRRLEVSDSMMWLSKQAGKQELEQYFDRNKVAIANDLKLCRASGLYAQAVDKSTVRPYRPPRPHSAACILR